MQPAGKSAKGRQGASAARETLSRERVARAALDLADRDGLDAFSMRRLADELGAGTMTLYGHFADKRQLLDAVIDVAMHERDLPALTGTWRDRLGQLVAHSLDLYERHPCVVHIWASQPVHSAAGLDWVEAALGTLREAGFGDQEVTRAFRLVIVYLHGYALFSGPRTGASARDTTRAAIAALPAEEYPNLRDLAEPFAGAMADQETFWFGFERILDGFEASLQQR